MATTGRILKTAVRDLYDRNIQRQWIQGYGEPEHQFEQIYSAVIIPVAGLNTKVAGSMNI